MDEQNYTNLGLFSLASLYGSFAISSLFLSSPFVMGYGAKVSIIVGAICYMLWVACGIIPISVSSHSQGFKTFIYILFIFSGIVNGFGASVIWVG